jgi:hypothetical protein
MSLHPQNTIDEFSALKQRAFPDREPIDKAALRFVKSWHRHPVLRDTLTYQGVNLGELDEFVLIQKIIPILVAAEGRAE